MRVSIGTSLIEISEGDISSQNTQAIVSATSGSILGTRGIDPGILRAAGPEILDECRQLGGCDTGEARVTGAGRLRAKFIIHTSGPVYRGGRNGEAELLSRAYRNSLALAVRLGVKRIAFPSLSTGANGYPYDEAADIAIRTVCVFLLEHPELLLVRFVLNSREAVASYEIAVKKLARPNTSMKSFVVSRSSQ